MRPLNAIARLLRRGLPRATGGGLSNPPQRQHVGVAIHVSPPNQPNDPRGEPDPFARLASLSKDVATIASVPSQRAAAPLSYPSLLPSILNRQPPINPRSNSHRRIQGTHLLERAPRRGRIACACPYSLLRLGVFGAANILARLQAVMRSPADDWWGPSNPLVSFWLGG
jgi:hypothetical protein